jgi:hypothetical protein
MTGRRSGFFVSSARTGTSATFPASSAASEARVSASTARDFSAVSESSSATNA